MLITITTPDDRVVNLDIEPSESIESIKVLLEVETDIPTTNQQLIYNGNPLDETKTLKSYGVSDGDLLVMVSMPAQDQAAQLRLAPDGSAVNPQAILRHLKQQPGNLEILRQTQPQLARAIDLNDHDLLQEQLRARHKAMQEQQRKRQEDAAEMARLASSDMMDPEVQRKIEEQIKKQNIEENLSMAWDHNPEVFTRVPMLYVNLEVNNVHIKAFVDTGAQSTIMTQQCAERCSLLRLLDIQFAGVAVGVGTSKILGRVHQVMITIQGQHFASSITVLEQKDGPEFIFGLDMLRRHQCQVDLQSNCLKFGQSDVSVPFLSEADIGQDMFTNMSEEQIKKIQEEQKK